MSDTRLKGIQRMSLNSERCVKGKNRYSFFSQNDNNKVGKLMRKSVTDLMNDESGK